MRFFGIEFKRIEPEYLKREPVSNSNISFIDRDSESTSAVIASSFTSGMFIDMSGTLKAEADLVTKYRDMCTMPEIDNAVDEIVNEAITTEDDFIVKIDLSDLEEVLDEKYRKVLDDEHNYILEMLDFNKKAYWIFRRWYVDGRLYYHCVVDEKRLQEGVKELRYIDPRKIRAIKEVAPKPIVGQAEQNAVAATLQTKIEYYLYNDRGFSAKAPYQVGFGGMATQGVRISKDSVVHVPSGLSDTNTTLGLSYLQKAIKVLSQLKTIEDSLIIYRLSRAPERRVWYVDVGNVNKVTADKAVRDIMINQKNKLIYDAETGAIQDSRKFLTMTEDYWLPRRCLSLDSKIKLLDGRDLELSEIIKEYNSGKENWTLSIDKNGIFQPSKIKWAGITKRNTKVMKITLDNNESVTVTLDHKFIMRDFSEKEAQYLNIDDSLMPCYTKKATLGPKYAPDYEYVHNNTGRDGWIPLHKLVNSHFNPNRKSTEVIHHKDFNRFNNNPDNLILMDKQDHLMLHANSGRSSWNNGKVEEHKKNLSIAGKQFFQTEEGIKRREEISLNNKTNENILSVQKEFNKNIQLQKEKDKLILNSEEYETKWGYHKPINPSGNHNPWNVNISYCNNEIFDNNFEMISDIINNMREYNLISIVNKINEKLNISFLDQNNIAKHIKRNGYNNVSDLLFKKYNHIHTRKRKLKYNHKIKNIEWLDETIDTGDIEVDNINHNFVLSIGIVIHNSDGSGTRVETLPAGQNLGQIDDIIYFQKLLYNSLNVPVDRLQSESPFSIGDTQEISRAEIKFYKFIRRIQSDFAMLFRETLKRQVILKGLLSLEEFESIEKKIKYTFAMDSHFTELKDNQILQMRAQAYAGLMQTGIIGKYISNKTIRRIVFQQSDEDIENETKLIYEEMNDPVLGPLYATPVPGEEGVAPEGGDEEPQQEEQPPQDSMSPQDQENSDREHKLAKAKHIIAAIKEIPIEKRTPGDKSKLRSAAQIAAKA